MSTKNQKRTSEAKKRSDRRRTSGASRRRHVDKASKKVRGQARRMATQTSSIAEALAEGVVQLALRLKRLVTPKQLSVKEPGGKRDVNVDAISMLDEQHDEVDMLFKELEKSTGRKKSSTFLQIADKLSLHTAIEEQIFYPAVKARRTKDILLESLEEHLAIKRALADLIDLDISDESFDAKATVLKEEVEHHVGEERSQLFPKVRIIFSNDELVELANQMEALMAELMSNKPDVRQETDEPAPI
jgi:hypothetical protein